MAWTFCTKEDVMDVQPITEAELKDSWSDMVEGLIKQHLDQPFLGGLEIITDEYHNGDSTNILVVRKSPIHSIEALYIDEGLVSTSDYVMFLSTIELKYATFPKGTLNVKVSYTSGSLVIPEPVRLAAVSMIAAMINYRKRYGADASVKWAKPDTKITEDTPNLNVGLTSHLQQIMKRVLRRDRVRVR
jgi:hypothetical protein